jgi:hypothetical protein
MEDGHSSANSPLRRRTPDRSGRALAAEKLACEWEARHDVAARGRRVDPAAVLQRYLTHTRVEEELRHQGRPAHRSGSVAARRAQHPDEFATRHPLVASWRRWGQDPR